ncbi:MAG: thiosulfate oxidation carrier protein SoxY [Magnetococcales bacterium]|nr:thiosulfate oxidation carrier protein SoxY [Magnetococcales bacterium]
MSEGAKKGWTRREFFHGVGAVSAACAVGGMAANALAAEEAAVDMGPIIAEAMGSKDVTADAAVKAELPEKADNATLVRVPVKIDHPMDAKNFIQSVGIFVDNNPKPQVAVFEFTPEVGKVDFEVRIKMAKPSKVRVIAKTNAGKLLGLEKMVDVAAGGCA